MKPSDLSAVSTLNEAEKMNETQLDPQTAATRRVCTMQRNYFLPLQTQQRDTILCRVNEHLCTQSQYVYNVYIFSFAINSFMISILSIDRKVSIDRGSMLHMLTDG